MPINLSEDDKIVRWYVFAVSYKKEIEIRDNLTYLGYEAYVPLHYSLHTYNGKKVRRQEPAVYGLVFAKGSKRQLLDFRETSRLKTYMFLKSHRMIDGTLQYVSVRDDDMDNFRKLNEVEGAKLTYYKPEELRLAKGEKVKIMDGPFEGITGIIQKLPNKRGQYLVVALPNVAFAAVNIKPEYIKPLTHKIAKSTNIEKDSKQLADLSLTLMMNDNAAQRVSIVDKAKQLMESLQGCKTYLPNDKANYYFAFYAAAMVLGMDTKQYKSELEKVMPRLKSNNLLLPLSHLLFYKETNDRKEMQNAEDIINKWDNTKYTDPQKRIIRLKRVLAHHGADDASSKQTSD